jgi:uncharacterized membrane protein
MGAPALERPPERRGRGWSDERVEELLGNLLRAGVLIAAAIATVGGVIYVAKYGAQPTDYRVFHGEPGDLRTIGGIVRGALQLRSRWLIQLGLLLLIATPIARVALSLFAFAKQRDPQYVLITAVVLGLLIFSLLIGHA